MGEHTQEQVAALGKEVQPSYPTVRWKDVPVELRDQATLLVTRYRTEVLDPVWERLGSCQFELVGPLWTEFWKVLPEDQGALLAHEEVCRVIALMDSLLMENAGKILLPDVLMPVDPKLAPGIRELAKNLLKWTSQATDGRPEQFVTAKNEAVEQWATCLKGQTSLNHVAQAARTVLQSNKNIDQMIGDWARVDFGDVERQTRWTCEDAVGLMQNIQTGFDQCLRSKGPPEDYVKWARSLVTEGIETKTPQEAADYLSEQLLRWSFIISLIIRDITLRSAPGFGNFHLFSLLFNEYLLYMVDSAKQNAYTQRLRDSLGEAIAEPA